jgi:hypothetical protein
MQGSARRGGFEKCSNLRKVVESSSKSSRFVFGESRLIASPRILPRQLAIFFGIEPDSVSFVRNAILIIELTVPSNSELDRAREQDFGLENPTREEQC